VPRQAGLVQPEDESQAHDLHKKVPCLRYGNADMLASPSLSTEAVSDEATSLLWSSKATSAKTGSEDVSCHENGRWSTHQRMGRQEVLATADHEAARRQVLARRRRLRHLTCALMPWCDNEGAFPCVWLATRSVVLCTEVAAAGSCPDGALMITIQLKSVQTPCRRRCKEVGKPDRRA